MHAPVWRGRAYQDSGGSKNAAERASGAVCSDCSLVCKLGGMHQYDQVDRCPLVCAHILTTRSLVALRPCCGMRVWLPKVPADCQHGPTPEDGTPRLSLCHGVYHAQLGIGDDACEPGHDTPCHRADVYPSARRSSLAHGAGDVENGCSSPPRHRRCSAILCRGTLEFSLSRLPAVCHH